MSYAMLLQAIPSPDPLGFPLPANWMLVLLNLTLALHWLFIGGAVGGAVMVLHNAFRRDELHRHLNRSLLGFLPFMVSMGVTIGVAPLLFVQVLYGNFFYSANVLIWGWWLGILPLIALNTYLFYWGKTRLQDGKKAGPAWAMVIVLGFVVVVTVLVSNMTLLQTPSDWPAMYAHGGMSLYGNEMVLPRAATAFLGFVAAGGLFVALLGRFNLLDREDICAEALRRGSRLAVISLLLHGAAAAWAVHTLPSYLKESVLDSVSGVLPDFSGHQALGSSLWLFVLTLISLLWLIRCKSRLATVVSLLVFLLYGLGVAFTRDAIRQDALQSVWGFSLGSVPVRPQWGAFALFGGFAVFMIGAIALLLRLAGKRIEPDSLTAVVRDTQHDTAETMSDE